MSSSVDITFTKAYQAAVSPMRADKAALGNLPVSAFQYCEAARAACGMGWYIFPAKTVSLMFDGRETFLADDGQWRSFTHESLESGFIEHWNKIAPPWLSGHAPSYIQKFPQPGIIQIWSGYFIETAFDLDLQIRPLINANTVSAFSCFEAIVEMDKFSPMPLFVNLQLHWTNSEILILKDQPLFQICAIPKAWKNRQASSLCALVDSSDIDESNAPTFNWNGLRTTLRISGVTEKRKSAGQYGAKVRRSSRTQIDD